MILTVLFHVKLPISTAERIKALLDRLAKAHADDAAKRKKLTEDEAISLALRGRSLTPTNALRIVIEAGLDALDKTKTEEALKKIAANPVVVGRPRGSIPA